jgi:hypothetical protein
VPRLPKPKEPSAPKSKKTPAEPPKRKARPKPKLPARKGAYAAHRDRAGERQAEQSKKGRDIGTIPKPANPRRRAKCERNLQLFYDTYLAEKFPIPWSPDHLKSIKKREEAILFGGRFALAMPRGSGKTSMQEGGAIFALVYGHRRFVALIGSTAGSCSESMESIKVELETNELLAADFPEVCMPIRALDGIANRANAQTCMGERTRIEWSDDKIILPTILGSKASGAVFVARGRTGRIRGLKHKTAGGEDLRPDLALADDLLTDDNAYSEAACEKVERLLARTILGLAGPKKKIAALFNGTVIRAGDATDRILDTKLHPEWEGERCKLLYVFPTNKAMWERYGEIRAESLRAGNKGVEATEFYSEHRDEMDAGAVVAWDERYNADELSALQHAMNLWIEDPAAFAAEMQNDPIPEVLADNTMTAEQIAGKVNKLQRGLVPVEATHLTAFIDVQGSLLYYVVTAWADNFTGWVVDYGTWPDQQRSYFSLRDALKTIQMATKLNGLEESLYKALTTLVDKLLNQEWPVEGGGGTRIERLLIDSRWGLSTNIVYKFCRETGRAPVVMPSQGQFIGASTKTMDQWEVKPGDRVGPNWRSPVPGKRIIRHVTFDSNYWKSFVHERLASPIGGKACLSLFGEQAATHRMIADHCKSEARIVVEGKGRVCDEWKNVKKLDNHWFDGLVGTAVAGSMLGCAIDESRPKKKVKKVAKSFAQMQAEALGAVA